MYHWQSYILPFFAALCLHVLLAWVFAGGLNFDHAPRKMVEPVKIVKASLVTIEKPRPVAKPRPKPVKKTKTKPAKKTEVKPRPKQEPVVKPVKVEPVKAEPVKDETLLDELFADEDQELQQDDELSQVARYVAAMRSEISSRWSRPPSTRNNMEVLLLIQLVPTGDVISVNVKQGSGNSAFDRSAVLAVEKVGRFEALQGMPTRLFEQNFRQIEIRFRPLDRRI